MAKPGLKVQGPRQAWGFGREWGALVPSGPSLATGQEEGGESCEGRALNSDPATARQPGWPVPWWEEPGPSGMAELGQPAPVHLARAGSGAGAGAHSAAVSSSRLCSRQMASRLVPGDGETKRGTSSQVAGHGGACLGLSVGVFRVCVHTALPVGCVTRPPPPPRAWNMRPWAGHQAPPARASYTSQSFILGTGD